MAGKKENIKALFSNTRSRVIIVFTALVLIATVVIGVAKLRIYSQPPVESKADVTHAPGIRSIPGSINPTEQYEKLQETQNINQASTALQKGGSAIPTIIRTQAFGEGIQPVGMSEGQSGVGFSTLSSEDEAGTQKSLWLQNLKDSSCSKSTVVQVVAQGAVLADLKQACSCTQLKDNGYQVSDLEPVCACKELKAAGFNARQLKDAGFSAGRLRLCGFDACELRNAGFTAQQMKDGGFSDGELKGAGFSDADILKASGLPNGVTEADIRNAGCQVDALKRLRAQGVSASAIRRINGCSAAQLKAAGYSAEDLRNAGFTAADLKNAGYSADELKKAGYSARDLLNAGFTPDELAQAGYTPGDIASAESDLPPGITPADIKSAGCDVGALTKERLAGVSAKLIKQYAGCSAKALKDAGFTDADLANAGFTAQEIQAAAAAETKPQAVDDAAIISAGCDPKKLKDLFNKGVSASRIKQLNGCSAQAMKDAGFDAKALSNAGFTPQELLDAGFTPQDLTKAGVSTAAVIAAGRTANCSVASLKAARASGVSATTIKQTLGCSASAMKAAGYTAAELRAAGFTAAELKNAGFTAAELKAAGFSAKELRDAGFSAGELKDAGFTAAELKDAGFSAAELKNAGFSAADLKAAGFSPKDLKDAGFSASDLKAAGFSAKDLKDAGYTASQLKAAGFSAAQLKDAGYSSADLQAAGFGSDVAGLENANIPGVVSNVAPLPSIPGTTPQSSASAQAVQAANAEKLQAILKKQNQQMDDQRFQQKIQQRRSEMMSSANQSLQGWKKVSTQTYIAGSETDKSAHGSANQNLGESNQSYIPGQNGEMTSPSTNPKPALIKTGDVLFAVMDTSVNSDEPGPILATIVSGKLKGAKLIGSFTLPTNADKMVISFNSLSVPGAAKTISIAAYAIDANTARTALSSNTDHHYLLRYGSLFASSFLEGFGNAFQSANTTVTIGGTGGGNNVTVQNGVGRSALENAVIGLATLGKSWGQVAQQQFNRPTTVEVYSGTGLGILFTQDLASI